MNRVDDGAKTPRDKADAAGGVAALKRRHILQGGVAEQKPISQLLDAAEAQAEAVAGGAETERRLVKRTPLSDFQRDLAQANTLIQGGWGKRGGISMHVSTTGSGKSVLEVQAAVCFNCGVPCCGLTPTRPFTTWVIQSEDDDDRVAFDRDGIVAHLADLHPDKDWNAATQAVQFLDFTGITGADFIETLDFELKKSPPDAVIVNPLNAYFGGNLKDGADASAFFKGGEIRRKETEGLEAVLKRHGVWCWLFAHTPKPPTAKELDGWLNDPFPEYKACGASEIADAVRSVITFLKVPGRDGVFSFTAGKNGKGLGWTDANGNPTNRAFFRWAQDGGHFWEAVPEAERPTIIGTASGAKPPKPPPPEPRDETELVRGVFVRFNGVRPKEEAAAEVRAAVNSDRHKKKWRGKDLSRDGAIALIDEMAYNGILRVLPKGTGGCRGCMCGLPDVIDRWLNERTTPASGDAGKGVGKGDSE